MLELGLATWRISKLLMDEAGPWNVVQRFRETFGFVHDDDGNIVAVPEGSVLGCIYCLSVWVGLSLVLLPPNIRRVFAVSAIAILVEDLLEHGKSAN